MSVKDRYAAPNDVYCPLWKKPMSKCCHNCAWWREIEGTNPNTGQPVREWHCAIAWQNILTLDNSNQQRITHKEVAALRNEIGAAKKTAAAIKAYEARMIGQNDGK